MTVTAGNIMDRSAALLSDPSKITFTYTLQLPFLTLAWDELQEELVANGILDVQELTSSPITVTAGITDLSPVGQPADLLFPIKLWERAVGQTDNDWIEMVEKINDPGEVMQVTELETWYWEENAIKFRGAISNREIKIRYQKDLISIVSDTSIISVTNSKSFLSHRTAALVAGSRGNRVRAKELNERGDFYLAKVTSTKVKDSQNKPIRPRRYGYSRRTYGNLRRRP